MSAIRGGRRLQVRREVPVRTRRPRAAQPAAPSQVQDGVLPHVPQRRLLPVRAALPLRAQRGRRAGPDAPEPRQRRLRVQRAQRRRLEPPAADESAAEHVDRIGPRLADWLPQPDQLAGQLPVPGPEQPDLLERIDGHVDDVLAELAPHQPAGLAADHGHAEHAAINAHYYVDERVECERRARRRGHPFAHLQSAQLLNVGRTEKPVHVRWDPIECRREHNAHRGRGSSNHAECERKSLHI